MRRDRTQHTQQVWGWKIGAYLFGAGMGAGAYAAGAAALWLPGASEQAAGHFAMLLGIVLVVLSVPFLIWDLDRPLGFFRVLWRPKTSWVSRGAWILTLFAALAAVTLVQSLVGSAPVRVLLLLSIVLALAVAAYTGLLLGSMSSRPLWNTPLLPVLFLVSALSTGIAAIGLGGTLFGGGVGGPATAFAGRLRSYHLGLLALELACLYFYLSVSHAPARGSVTTLLSGSLRRPFWLGVTLTGLVLPLALESLAYLAPATGVHALELLADAGVLIGGFLLRRVILAAGARGVDRTLGVPFLVRPGI